jgi:hypothetical protein
MDKFIERLKTDRGLQVSIGVVVLVIIGFILVAKFTGKEKQDIMVSEQGEESKTSTEEYSSEFPDLSKPQAPINPDEVSPISGMKCETPENKDRRPIAVMVASNERVRPVSGTSQADMVIEMPVITAQITRLMAVYVCNSPEEIGSVRSTRHDYITLAKGLDAILGHWGGSHFALDYLKDPDTVPNIDALAHEGQKGQAPFWRKDIGEINSGMSEDTGFASYDQLRSKAQELGYRTQNHFEGYPHRNESPMEERGEGGDLTVGFAGSSRVEYTYDPKTNSYLREWGGVPDIDKVTQEQIAPKNVVVMFASSRQIESQYNDVDVEGGGDLFAYIEGKEIEGKWEKKKGNCAIGNEYVCVNSAKLKFMDGEGEEIKFIPGQIWVEVLEPGQKLKWVPVGGVPTETETPSTTTEETNP